MGAATPKPSPSAIYNPSTDDWKRCGSDVAPPADVLRMPVPPSVSAVRQHGRAGNDCRAEADRDVAGAIREGSIELWAKVRGEPALMEKGCLGPIRARNLNWGGEIDLVKQAQNLPGGGHLEWTGTSHPIAARVVAIPDSVRSYLMQTVGETGVWALMITVAGSGTLTEVGGTGQRMTLNRASEDSIQSFAFFGRYVDGAPLGPL
jgi:hypothetical protein